MYRSDYCGKGIGPSLLGQALMTALGIVVSRIDDYRSSKEAKIQEMGRLLDKYKEVFEEELGLCKRTTCINTD